MYWNKEVNGFVCPYGCFAVYEIPQENALAGHSDAYSSAIDYLEMVNCAAKEEFHGY
jgi:hypothetical protein